MKTIHGVKYSIQKIENRLDQAKERTSNSKDTTFPVVQILKTKEKINTKNEMYANYGTQFGNQIPAPIFLCHKFFIFYL